MHLKTLFFTLFIAISFCAGATPPDDSTAIYAEQYKQYADSLNDALKYTTGKIDLEGGHVTLKIPAGFKYLNKEQSKSVLLDVWGNPESNVEGVLGTEEESSENNTPI